MQARCNAWPWAILIACSANAVQANDEDAIRQGAESLIRQGSVAYLTDREQSFESDSLGGTAKTVEPDKFVSITITDFVYVPGKIAVTYKVGSRCSFDGHVAVDNTQHPSKGIADVSVEVELVAKYDGANGVLGADARITHLDDVEVHVVELEPDGDVAVKKQLESQAAKAISDHRDDIIRDVNDWMAKQSPF